MELLIRPYRADDLAAMAAIWNQVVEDGVAFPPEETRTCRRPGPFSASSPTAAWPRTGRPE